MKEKHHFPSSNVIIFMLPPSKLSDDIFTTEKQTFFLNSLTAEMGKKIGCYLQFVAGQQCGEKLKEVT